MSSEKHHPAAFINAIAEEGTKAEAVEWLQMQWNENCELRATLAWIVEQRWSEDADLDDICLRAERALEKKT